MESLTRNKNKIIRSLSVKKYRDKEGLFVVEGEKIVNELLSLDSGKIDFIVTTNATLKVNVPCYLVDESEMRQLSSMKTPASILAVVNQSNTNPDLSNLVIVLDNIQDPGNLGTIIRTADWFGVKTILCSKGTVDLYNPKVIQSTMGAIFRVNVIYCDLDTVLNNTTKKIYGALLDGENLYATKLENDAFLVIGNEGNGISPSIKELISDPITIPKYGESESLNAAVACAILVSHFRA